MGECLAEAQEHSDRFGPIDVLRGWVILLMALDHIRGFVAPSGANPTDWDTATFAFFLVRWVTHLCAPTFIFLMGVSAALRYRKKPDDMQSFLIKRGLWLILLELTWVSFSWSWDITQSNLGVLWSLGGAMLLLAPVIHLPAKWLATAGGLLVVGLELANVQIDGPLRILFQPTSVAVFGHRVGGAYVLLPWFGVALLGWGVAHWLVSASQSTLQRVGAALLLAFVVYRTPGATDPDPWVAQASPLMTVADFLNPSKYPPSICFVLMTLGAAALVLSVSMRSHGQIMNTVQTFGRVPMFVYLIHLPVAHLMGNAYAWLVYGTARVPATESVSVPFILGAWAVLLVVIWPLCKHWDQLKRGRPQWAWLRYL